MKLLKMQFVILVLFLSFGSCQNNPSESTNKSKETLGQADLVSADGHVLTAEEQALLTPQLVIDRLKSGNFDYVNNKLTLRDYPLQASKSVKGQYPMAVILSCIDSRVPVEQVFNLGIGDVFVARVAGNIVSEDILGSLEYSCKVAGSKLVLVLGHEACGAVKAAIDQVELGNITPLLDKIQPAVAEAQTFDGEKTTSNKAFVNHVVELNVLESMAQIRKESPILKAMEDNGEIRIVGAYYDLHTGKVTFLEED